MRPCSALAMPVSPRNVLPDLAEKGRKTDLFNNSFNEHVHGYVVDMKRVKPSGDTENRDEADPGENAAADPDLVAGPDTRQAGEDRRGTSPIWQVGRRSVHLQMGASIMV